MQQLVAVNGYQPDIPTQGLLSFLELRGIPLCKGMNTMILEEASWVEYLNILIGDYGDVIADAEEIAVTDLVTQVVHHHACGYTFQPIKEGGLIRLALVTRDGTAHGLSLIYPDRVFQQTLSRRFVVERCSVILPTPEGIAHVNSVRVQRGYGLLRAGRF